MNKTKARWPRTKSTAADKSIGTFDSPHESLIVTHRRLDPLNEGMPALVRVAAPELTQATTAGTASSDEGGARTEGLVYDRRDSDSE